MKRVAAIFSGISFLVALAAAGLLALNMAVLALATAWGGSLLTLLTYRVVLRSMRQAALQGPKP